jgi:hypothetical protein
MAGFNLIINGRFWVITEARRRRSVSEMRWIAELTFELDAASAALFPVTLSAQCETANETRETGTKE